MEKRFLIDTNILIYFLDGKIPVAEFEKITNIFQKSFNISTISKVEVLGWHKISLIEKNNIESFISTANIFYIDKIIENRAIVIKQENKINIPDALIGATALVNKMTIVTRNEDDFKKIKGLKIYNPFK